LPEDGLEAEDLEALPEPEPLPEPDLEEDVDQEVLDFDDLMDEGTMPDLSDDDLLPDDTEISLDEDLFKDDEPETDGSDLIDGDLEPDEVLSVEGLANEEFPIEESFGSDLEPADFSEVLEYQSGIAEDQGPPASPWDQGSEETREGELALDLPVLEAAVVDPEKLAQARMFEYLAGLTGQLPPEKAHKAEELRLSERLDNLAKALVGEKVENLAIRTKGDRRNQPDRRQGPRRGDAARDLDLKPTLPPEPADETIVVTETFDMIGKISKFLPPEQKQQLRERMKKIMDVMERYRH
jgi:hypothetical protein